MNRVRRRGRKCRDEHCVKSPEFWQEDLMAGKCEKLRRGNLQDAIPLGLVWADRVLEKAKLNQTSFPSLAWHLFNIFVMQSIMKSGCYRATRN